jgi:transcriptional regulator with XRE-family HTH domain
MKHEKSYRHAYADENLNLTIATQIKVLREQRHWNQDTLAQEARMTQPMISRYENVNYSSWSIKTLEKLAYAFDAWLDVRIRPFGELVATVDEFSRESLQVPAFDDDPFFKEMGLVASLEKNERISKVPSAGKRALPDVGGHRMLNRPWDNAPIPGSETQSLPLVPPKQAMRPIPELMLVGAGR